MPGLVVSKFGGSSLTKYADIERIAKIAADDPRRKVIVVSAPGRRYKDDTKVTDLLIRLSDSYDKERNIWDDALMVAVSDHYKSLFANGEARNAYDLLRSRLVQSTEPGKRRRMAAVKAFGEEMVARIVADTVGAEFVNPADLFVFSDNYEAACVLPESDERIRQRLGGIGKPVIVPGFYGFTTGGDVATLSRGGSDLTGAYLAAALDADTYENFTDTDGIYAADPAMVDGPKKIDVMTFDEIRDLAYSGFRVFHEEAMHPVARKHIPVHVRNTFRYPAEGTYIVRDRLSDPERPVVGVAYKDGFCGFQASVFGLSSMVGAGEKMLRVFADREISVEYITGGIDDLSFVVGKEKLDSPTAVNDIIRGLHGVLGEDAEIDFGENMGSLVVAGKGLKGKKGISAGIQSTLADADINIRFITQGPRENSIVYGIDSRDSKRAVKAIYDKYLR